MNNMALHMIREMFHKREHSFMVKLRFWFHPILTIYIYIYIYILIVYLVTRKCCENYMISNRKDYVPAHFSLSF